MIQQAAIGGYTIREEPAVDGQGRVLRDDDGAILMKRTFAIPDGRLALAFLARSRPKAWGQKARNDWPDMVVTENDHPEADGQVSELAERLHAVAEATRRDRSSAQSDDAIASA